MRQHVFRVIPFSGFDLLGLEGWLAAQAAEGLRFLDTFGPMAVFERETPQTVQVHLEPIYHGVEEDPELTALYEQAGWQDWGIFQGNFYVFATTDLQAQAHTDPETLDHTLKRFFRAKLATGLLLACCNVLLLGLYWNGAPWTIGWSTLHYFPLEVLARGDLLPFLLALAGLVLVDAAYLLGLFQLRRCRRAMLAGRPDRGLRGPGWLRAAGLLLLLPVLVNTLQLFTGRDYRPYDLEGSGFVTLTDLEGEDFRLSQDPLMSMNYVAHGGTLLQPEYWSLRQYGAFPSQPDGHIPTEVPHWTISVTRWPLEGLAQAREEEYLRQSINLSGDHEALPSVPGLDSAFYARREAREEGGPSGGILVLRRGSTVLFADYYGEQDLTRHVADLAQMLGTL